MTDEEEFSARSQLKWTREGDAWILLHRRRRMGRVVPDKNHLGMWRSVKVVGILSDTAGRRDAGPAEIATKASGLFFATLRTASKPSSAQTSAKSRIKP